MVGNVDTDLGRGHRFSITTVQTLAVIAHLSLSSCIVSSFDISGIANRLSNIKKQIPN